MHVSVGCQEKLPVDGGCTFMIFMAIAKLLSVEAVPHITLLPSCGLSYFTYVVRGGKSWQSF